MDRQAKVVMYKDFRYIVTGALAVSHVTDSKENEISNPRLPGRGFSLEEV